MTTSNLTPKRPWQLPRVATTEPNDVVIVDQQGGTARSVPIAGLAGALVGPPGANGTNGTNGAPGAPGATGPVGEGSGGLFFESRAAAVSATIGVGIKAIRTAGFSTYGDGGHALYKRRSGAPTLTSNPFYIHSADGAWWEMVPQGGVVSIEQFGGKGDWNGTTGTDNLQPVYDAVDACVARVGGDVKPTLCIQFGGGQYKFSNTLEFHNPTWLRGLGRSLDTQGAGEPTQLYFPGGICSMRVYSRGLQGVTGSGSGLPSTGAGSIIEGFGISQLGDGTYIADAHGIHLRGSATIAGISFYNINGDAIRIATGFAGGGNANRWFIENVQVHACGGHGLAILGNDSNAGVCRNFYTKSCGKCGIFEHETLGNEFFGLELDGYGNKGVHYLGKLYQQGSVDAHFTVPGTDRAAWYYLYDDGPSSQFPNWDPAHDYGPDDLRLPLFVSGGSSRSIFAGMYVEGGAVFSDLGNSGSMAIQPGQAGFTNRSAILYHGGALGCPTGFVADKQFRTGDPGYAAHGASLRAGIGGTAVAGGALSDADMDLLYFNADADGGIALSARFTSQHNFEWAWFNQPSTCGITGPRTTFTFGKNSASQYKMYSADLGLVDPFDPANSRLIGFRGGVPTRSGEYARGERYYNSNPSAGGSEGWVCVTSGAIADGAWSARTISGGEILSTAAGRVYRNGIFGASTVEPTHTSGIVTTSDGMTWAYLGNGAPVFKTFGAISA